MLLMSKKTGPIPSDSQTLQCHLHGPAFRHNSKGVMDSSFIVLEVIKTRESVAAESVWEDPERVTCLESPWCKDMKGKPLH